jgi:hypothetical protein
MGFDADLVLKEITETRQWKIVIDDKIACILPSHLKTKAFGKEKIVIKPFLFS